MPLKKRIKLIVNAIPLQNVGTGIGRYLEGLYSCLEKAYDEVFEIGYFTGVSVSKKRPRGPADLDQWSSTVDLFWKLPTSVALSARVIIHLQREILFRRAARNFDIYHEAAFFPFSYNPAVGTVFTLHDLSLLLFPQFHPKERVIYSKIFLRRNCRNVDHFVTDSDFIKRQVIEHLGIDEHKITAILLAHDRSIFYPRGSTEVDLVRRQFGLPLDYFISVGSGDPRKNMEIIPEALKLADLNIPLVLVGWSGWAANSSSGADVCSLGYVDNNDLAKLYSGALGLIYPSLYEGFGLPILEAMACRCPVICSRRSSIPEVAGSAALFMNDPHSPAELAGLLTNLAHDSTLRTALAKKGETRADSFSWERTTKQMVDIFKSL